MSHSVTILRISACKITHGCQCSNDVHILGFDSTMCKDFPTQYWPLWPVSELQTAQASAFRELECELCCVKLNKFIKNNRVQITRLYNRYFFHYNRYVHSKEKPNIIFIYCCRNCFQEIKMSVKVYPQQNGPWK